MIPKRPLRMFVGFLKKTQSRRAAGLRIFFFTRRGWIKAAPSLGVRTGTKNISLLATGCSGKMKTEEEAHRRETNGINSTSLAPKLGGLWGTAKPIGSARDNRIGNRWVGVKKTRWDLRRGSRGLWTRKPIGEFTTESEQVHGFEQVGIDWEGNTPRSRSVESNGASSQKLTRTGQEKGRLKECWYPCGPSLLIAPKD